MAKLENWCVRGDPWLAPEMQPTKLVGTVTGHPRKVNGTRISTSAIVAVAGRLVTTRSGTVYELGEPEPAYVAWMRENGISFDPENPIKVKG